MCATLESKLCKIQRDQHAHAGLFASHVRARERISTLATLGPHFAGACWPPPAKIIDKVTSFSGGLSCNADLRFNAIAFASPVVRRLSHMRFSGRGTRRKSVELRT
jgi:hypothetical protein